MVRESYIPVFMKPFLPDGIFYPVDASVLLYGLCVCTVIMHKSCNN